MANDTTLYPYSYMEAVRLEEQQLWQESHEANIACKKGIEETLRKNHDGACLEPAYMKEIIGEFGYKRTAFVLANTIAQTAYGITISPQNRAWSRTVGVPPDDRHNGDFAIRCNPAVLDSLTYLYRHKLDDLHLFSATHCATGERDADYTGRGWC